MKTFILGYNADDNICPDLEPEKLREYTSIEQADYESKEWCTVKAKTLNEAKKKYEKTFEDHKKNGRIKGAFSKIN